MNINNLHFFDNNGYNLNFTKNEKFGYWEGFVYLPKVSVGVYANTTIYILEYISNSNTNNEIVDNSYFFPVAAKSGDKITFTWDNLNTFVDEFFMFDFDDSYVLKETSALVYTPNDGPDCNTLIINRFDVYEVPLDRNLSSKALPIHIAFMANEKYDATTYNRTLVMSYNDTVIARIKFFAETVEEDERLKVWNSNLGYNITPEDTMIFYKSDIKEYRPDYSLLNEKRKELMMEGSNIYPYIGSYKAIINAIKFFGYNNLNIIEYWRNVNPNDENFGKIYHSSKYSLTKKETLRIGARNIILPNKDYKKMNSIALVYSINKPTGIIDDWELPKVKEQFTYTIEEALIKLFALRKKLNKEFMPGSSKIIDIIGEANYFGIHSITKIHNEYEIQETSKKLKLDFDIEPGKYIHITDNEYFNRYINIKQNRSSTNNLMLSDMFNVNLGDILSTDQLDIDELITINDLTNNQKCEYYKNYHKDVFENHLLYKEINDNDSYPYEHDEYEYYTTPYDRYSAKVVLTNTSLIGATFGNCELKFGCDYYVNSSNSNNISSLEPKRHEVTFGNIKTYCQPTNISWKVSMSEPELKDDSGKTYQIDDDLREVGILKKYEWKDIHTIDIDSVKKRYTKTYEEIESFNQVFFELPYVGYYDVTIEIDGQKRTKKKCIKVEPYQLELIGFYYDARNLPDKIKYENPKDSVLYNFINDSINTMYGFAKAERTSVEIPVDYSVPIYNNGGEIIIPGPYFNHNIDDEWYLADNLTYEIGKLEPIVKYTRYIRNGVDVKPYTWFILGFEYSKVAGKIEPHWSIKNNNTTSEPQEYDGQYLTLLLKKEGHYTVTLTIKDKNSNEYSISRNIIVVDKAANYNLYQPFKKDYDYMIEQKMLMELNTAYPYDDFDYDISGGDDSDDDVYPQIIPTKIDGIIESNQDTIPVIIDGTVESNQETIPASISGTVESNQDVTPVFIDGTVESNQETIPATIDGSVESNQDVTPVSIDGTIESNQETIPASISGTIENT